MVTGAGGQAHKCAGEEGLGRGGTGVLAEGHTALPRYYRDELLRRVRMGRHLVTGWEFEAHSEGPALRWIAIQDRDLRPRREPLRWLPFEHLGLDDGSLAGGLGCKRGVASKKHRSEGGKD